MPVCLARALIRGRGRAVGDELGVAVVLGVLDLAEVGAVEELLEEHHLGALLRRLVRVALVLLDHRLLVAGPAGLQERTSDVTGHGKPLRAKTRGGRTGRLPSGPSGSITGAAGHRAGPHVRNGRGGPSSTGPAQSERRASSGPGTLRPGSADALMGHHSRRSSRRGASPGHWCPVGDDLAPTAPADAPDASVLHADPPEAVRRTASSRSHGATPDIGAGHRPKPSWREAHGSWRNRPSCPTDGLS